MEGEQNIFGRCFICLTNSLDFNLNVGLSLDCLCKYLNLDLQKREKEQSEIFDLSVPLCPNCEKSMEKFNSLYQGLEKIKMEMDYQFELVKNLICDNSVNGYNDYWKSVARLRQQILPKCLERRWKYQPKVKIKRIQMSKMNIKKRANKKRDLFKPSILQEAIASIKLEEVDFLDPDCLSDVFDDANPLEAVDDYEMPSDDLIFPRLKVERGINSKMTEIGKGKIATKPLLKGQQRPKKKYVCSICGAGYTTKDKLNNHVRHIHEGYRAVCKVPGCNREFSVKSLLTQHMRKVHPHLATPARPYGRSKFHDKFTKILVKEEPKFQCNFCKISYKHLVHFQRHFGSAHRPPVRYDCGACGKSFSRKDYLSKHRKSCYVSK